MSEFRVTVAGAGIDFPCAEDQAVLDAAEAAGRARARDVLDLKGATLIPGFHDAHNHMIGFGLSLTEIDLRVGSLDEIYARVAARAAVTSPGEWIVGAGYGGVQREAREQCCARDRACRLSATHVV